MKKIFSVVCWTLISFTISTNASSGTEAPPILKKWGELMMIAKYAPELITFEGMQDLITSATKPGDNRNAIYMTTGLKGDELESLAQDEFKLHENFNNIKKIMIKTAKNHPCIFRKIHHNIKISKYDFNSNSFPTSVFFLKSTSEKEISKFIGSGRIFFGINYKPPVCIADYYQTNLKVNAIKVPPQKAKNIEAMLDSNPTQESFYAEAIIEITDAKVIERGKGTRALILVVYNCTVKEVNYYKKIDENHQYILYRGRDGIKYGDEEGEWMTFINYDLSEKIYSIDEIQLIYNFKFVSKNTKYIGIQ